MKNLIRLSFSVSILLISIIYGCQSQKNNKLEKTGNISVSDLETTIKKRVDSFYKVYKQHDYDWIDFFEDEFTNVFPDTPIRKISKDSTKAIWKGIYKRNDVQLISHGKPSFITSQDMVISHNSFKEIFINKQSKDTIKIIGTYLVAWRRQPNDSWKIVFESVLNN
jgi:hypothetical protein